MVLSGRALHGPAAALTDAGAQQSLRQLHRVHRRVPDAAPFAARTSSTRAAAFPISPSSIAASIPVELRKSMGNRIYGCDDCQLVCPWNRYARPTGEGDFRPRHGLDDIALADLFAWSEATFLERTAGSAIRRIGYERWLRNIAVALGNAPRLPTIKAALERRRDDPSALVREHVGLGGCRSKRRNKERDRSAKSSYRFGLCTFTLSINLALPSRAAARILISAAGCCTGCRSCACRIAK